MTNVPITYAGVDYLDRTRPLLDGTVQPEGISLTVVSFQEPSAFFRRVAQATEFDAAEMSWSTYAHLLSRGDDRYIAIPFFPSRHFRHGDIYVHRDSGIAHPTDLRGQKVGIPQYRMTAGVWQRAFLQHDYGVLPGVIAEDSRYCTLRDPTWGSHNNGAKNVDPLQRIVFTYYIREESVLHAILQRAWSRQSVQLYGEFFVR